MLLREQQLQGAGWGIHLPLRPRMSGSCNGAKSSQNHMGSVLHLRDWLEHREKPNPSSQVSSVGVNILPVRTVPKNPLLAPNLFPFPLPGRGAVPIGQRSCDSTGHWDRGAWRYSYVETQVLVGTWQHGCVGT